MNRSDEVATTCCLMNIRDQLDSLAFRVRSDHCEDAAAELERLAEGVFEVVVDLHRASHPVLQQRTIEPVDDEEDDEDVAEDDE